MAKVADIEWVPLQIVSYLVGVPPSQVRMWATTHELTMRTSHGGEVRRAELINIANQELGGDRPVDGLIGSEVARYFGFQSPTGFRFWAQREEESGDLRVWRPGGNAGLTQSVLYRVDDVAATLKIHPSVSIGGAKRRPRRKRMTSPELPFETVPSTRALVTQASPAPTVDNGSTQQSLQARALAYLARHSKTFDDERVRAFVIEALLNSRM